jgi:hypothetical protein
LFNGIKGIYLKMKSKKHSLIFLLIISIGALMYFLPIINFKPLFADIEIEKRFYANYFPESVSLEKYAETAAYEDKNGKTFPRIRPNKVVLVENTKFLKKKYDLSANEVRELLGLLNDSTNYEWGELGTPEVHYYFEYFNKNGELIGVTKVDLEGMAYSEPYLGKMKWCGFKNIEELTKLIRKIEE